jgi:hypothetical protein
LDECKERTKRVLENRALMRICGPEREEVPGNWRILHNDELRNLYSSPNIARVTKSRKVRWPRNAARMGETRNAYKISVEKGETTKKTQV